MPDCAKALNEMTEKKVNTSTAKRDRDDMAPSSKEQSDNRRRPVHPGCSIGSLGYGLGLTDRLPMLPHDHVKHERLGVRPPHAWATWGRAMAKNGLPPSP